MPLTLVTKHLSLSLTPGINQLGMFLTIKYGDQ